MRFKKIGFGVALFILVLIAGIVLWRAKAGGDTDSTDEVANQEESASENTGVDEDSGSDSTTESEEQQESKEAEPVVHQGEFELPIEGSAGYSSTEMPLYSSASSDSEVKTRLAPGSEFEILSEEGEWWQIQTPETTGWIQHQYAFINLPDVVPSIVYDNTNSYESQFTSSGYSIPNLTNQVLYDASDYNERLEEETFIMPILYATAKKVNEAQQRAQANGESLKMYETYRPYQTQQRVVDNLAKLAQENRDVWEGLNRGPWSQAWFIITGEVSNHQIGAAMDVSLVSVDNMEEKVVGDYKVREVTDYTDLGMQTPMHELSADSVIFQSPIPNDSKTAWQEVPLVGHMTEASKRLQQYATEAGFTPIASEWWHFNDLDALESLGENTGTGDFQVSRTLNSPPEIEENQNK